MSKPTALLQAIDERTRLLDELAATGQFDHPAWKGANRVARYDAGAGKCKLADPGAKALLDQADDDQMAIPFVVSTYAMDRDGDVVVPAGLKNWLAAYARNPIWLFAHQPGLLPIGLSRDSSAKCTVQILEDRVLAVCHFHKETEVARDIYRLTKAGILNATSIGFIPHKGKRLKRMEDPTLERDDVDFDWPGFVFTDWELCEISICVIQSNRDAIRMSLDKGVDGRPLGDQARHLILPYAPRKASVVSGWGGLVTVLVPKAQFPTEDAAIAHALGRGLDVSDCCDGPDGWIFRQPDPAQFCRPTGGNGNMGSTSANENKTADKPASTTTATGGTMTQTSTTTTGAAGTAEQPVRKGRRIPKSAFDMLASLYGLSAKEVADDAAMASGEADKQDQQDEEDKPQLPPGATVLAAIKEVCETALPLTEQPDVQKFLTKMLAEAGKCAVKAYPDLDLGFEPVDDEDESEEDDEEGDPEEKEDDPEDDEEMDDEEEKELGDLLNRLERITGR